VCGFLELAQPVVAEDYSLVAFGTGEMSIVTDFTGTFGKN